MYDRSEIIEARSYKVVKANEIIQRAKHDLSLSELKTFAYIVSKIQPQDRSLEYSFTINEYCRVLGIDTNNGRNILHVKQALKQLRDKSFWIKNKDGQSATIGWLDKVWVNEGSGRIRVRLDEDLQEYVIGLQANYTQYELICTLPMQSKYSIRIYELLKSYAFNRHTHTFDLEQLKEMLGCTKYQRFPDFRRKVLEIAVREINEFTDIEVSWSPVNKGRKVVQITFEITKRDTWRYYQAVQRANEQLDGQLTIFDIGNQKHLDQSKP